MVKYNKVDYRGSNPLGTYTPETHPEGWVTSSLRQHPSLTPESGGVAECRPFRLTDVPTTFLTTVGDFRIMTKDGNNSHQMYTLYMTFGVQVGSHVRTSVLVQTELSSLLTPSVVVSRSGSCVSSTYRLDSLDSRVVGFRDVQ